jgi:bifunctional DNA primase/polymerase-like protein
MSFIDAAETPRNYQVFHDLFEMGFRLIPCRGKTDAGGKAKAPHFSKRDLAGRNLHDCYARDPSEIDVWLKRWPDAVPGLLCGPQDDSGWSLLVVDIDSDAAADKHGLANFDKTFGPPEQWCSHIVDTQSGGGSQHLYYKLSPADVADLRGNQPDLVRDVNTRGAHGYVIGPGAIMADGRVYSARVKGVTFNDLNRIPPPLMARLSKHWVEKPIAPEPVKEAEPVVTSGLGEAHMVSGLDPARGADEEKVVPFPRSSPSSPFTSSAVRGPSENQVRSIEMQAARSPAPGEDRSRTFDGWVKFAVECGMLLADIIAIAEKNPTGVAAKYCPPEEPKNRIAQEVERSYKKHQHRFGAYWLEREAKQGGSAQGDLSGLPRASRSPEKEDEP